MRGTKSTNCQINGVLVDRFLAKLSISGFHEYNKPCYDFIFPFHLRYLVTELLAAVTFIINMTAKHYIDGHNGYSD